MARDIRTIRAAALDALGSFRLYEFAPFGWILAAELIVLVLAMNLGTAWGMGTAGWLAARIAGEGPLHYPAFYAFLPTLMTDLEVLLYAFAGSYLIPLATLRVLQGQNPARTAPGEAASRARGAYLPVLIGAILSTILIVGIQWVLGQQAVSGTIRGLLRGGFIGTAGVAIVGMLAGYAVWTLFVYVPVSSVQPGRSLGAKFAAGFREGLENFLPTYVVVIGLSLPAAAILLVLQVMGIFLVGQIRPEIIGVLIGLYSLLSMLATFFIYSAAARYYQARRGEAA
jgi:hypothetical protein